MGGDGIPEVGEALGAGDLPFEVKDHELGGYMAAISRSQAIIEFDLAGRVVELDDGLAATDCRHVAPQFMVFDLGG